MPRAFARGITFRLDSELRWLLVHLNVQGGC